MPFADQYFRELLYRAKDDAAVLKFSNTNEFQYRFCVDNMAVYVTGVHDEPNSVLPNSIPVTKLHEIQSLYHFMVFPNKGTVGMSYWLF